MEDVDPEFLALSERQRAAVDKAFSRGLQRPGKRRRLDRKAKSTPRISQGAGSVPADEDAGGFLPDEEAGGFLPDDEAGGFVPDDDEGGGFLPDEGDGGGFVADEPSAAPTAAGAPTDRVPLGRVPALLASLGLPSDEDVLAVFRASAAGWDDEEEGGGGSVELKDWRAVCAALMTPGDDEALQDEEEGDDLNEDLSSLSSDEDDFQPSADDDDEEGSEYGKKSASTTPAPRRRQKRQPKAHLSSQQKELSRDIWAMLKPQGGPTLSKDEVKKWAREMGEMWSDDEITDMVSMFGGGANYLSFDQFCTVLLRAGLV